MTDKKQTIDGLHVAGRIGTVATLKSVIKLMFKFMNDLRLSVAPFIYLSETLLFLFSFKESWNVSSVGGAASGLFLTY